MLFYSYKSFYFNNFNINCDSQPSFPAAIRHSSAAFGDGSEDARWPVYQGDGSVVFGADQ